MKIKFKIILKFIIGTEVTTLKSGSLQMGWFYLVLEFEREGSATTGYSFQFVLASLLYHYCHVIFTPT